MHSPKFFEVIHMSVLPFLACFTLSLAALIAQLGTGITLRRSSPSY